MSSSEVSLDSNDDENNQEEEEQTVKSIKNPEWLKELIRSIQSSEAELGIASLFVLKEVHSELVQLKEEVTSDKTKLSDETRKQLRHRFLELWTELSTASVNITLIDQASICECFDIVSSIYDIALPVFRYLFKGYKAGDSQQRLLTGLAMLDLPHILVFLKADGASPGESMNYANVYRILPIACSTSPLVSPAAITTLHERVKLFTILKKHVDQRMASINENSMGTNITRILSFFWNVSDRTIVVPILIEAGLHESVVRWLSQSDNVSNKQCRAFITTLYNLARHDEGTDELNRHGAIAAIKRFQSTERVKANTKLSLSSSMALALLSTPEQLKSDQKCMDGVLSQLLQLTKGAAKGARYRCGGCHVSEPLAVMAKLFVVEERTIDYVLCHAETKPPSDISSTIRLFASLLLAFRSALDGNNPLKQFTLIAVLNILWSISFQAQYSQELITSNDELISIVKSLAESDDKKAIDQYKSRSMEGVKEAACGILLNLHIDVNDNSKQKEEIRNDEINILNPLPLASPLKSGTKKPSIMISYSHKNKEFCVKLLELLSTRSDVFDIWIDQTHCQSVADLWESIADGMEQAQIIVCLISKHYYESKSCRQELQYATDTLHKHIVPALLEDFEPRSWLGIRISGVKYIRFRNLAQPDEAKMVDLLDTILGSFATSSSSLEVLSIVQRSSKQHEHYEPEIAHGKNSTIDSRRLPIEQWSSATIDDINKWFVHHHISSEIRNLYNFQAGDEMLHYAQMLIDDYENQIQIYSKAFRKKYNGDELLPHEFDRFKRAMEKLLKDNSMSVPSQASTKQERMSSTNPVRSKSTTCCIL